MHEFPTIRKFIWCQVRLFCDEHAEDESWLEHTHVCAYIEWMMYVLDPCCRKGILALGLETSMNAYFGCFQCVCHLGHAYVCDLGHAYLGKFIVM
jgi:hypothetical protein